MSNDDAAREVSEDVAGWKAWHRELVEALGGTVVERQATLALARLSVGHHRQTKPEARPLQRLADEAAAWRKRYGMNTGSIIDRIADLGDAERWVKETQEAMKDAK